MLMEPYVKFRLYHFKWLDACAELEEQKAEEVTPGMVQESVGWLVKDVDNLGMRVLCFASDFNAEEKTYDRFISVPECLVFYSRELDV